MNMVSKLGVTTANLLGAIGGENKNVGVLFKRLSSGMLSYTFQVYFRRRHDLHDVE